MKCEECTANALEQFLDGELDARRAAETRAHLAACHNCAAAYEELLAEQAIYASYERDLDGATPQAMWDGIAARLAAEPPREKSFAVAAAPGLFGRAGAWLTSLLVVPRFSPALTAALMLVAIGATATAMRYLNSQPAQRGDLASASHSTPAPVPANVVREMPEATPAAAPVVAQNNASRVGANDQANEREKDQKAELPRRRDAERKPAATPADPAQILAAAQNNELARRQRATERLVREAESKYLAAIRMLSEDVNRKRTNLDPQVAARFDETLATIDRSIAETRRTVLQQRNDPVAVQYMLSAYAKKVEVMREMAALD